jgi:membrane protease YdiL (CAAX protease family)
VVVILLATHMASGDRWAVHWDRVGWMYMESAAFSAPLLVLNWAVPLGPDDGVGTLIHRLALGIGAGIYEELVFRLIIISLIVIVAGDLLRLDRSGVAVAAVILSSLAFAAHHHRPIGVELFDPLRFIFRSIAGVYLAAIFWFRGYGPAAGCHAAYNVALVIVTSLRP